MNKNIFISGIFFLAGIFYSCKKSPVLQTLGEPAWIKVMADSSVKFIGKIRSDGQNNLFCSYNYRNNRVDGYSAIIKLDVNGNLAWRREFTNLAVYDFVVTLQGNVVIVSYSNGMIIFNELSVDGGDSIFAANPLLLPSLTSDKIKNLIGIKIERIPSGNYHIVGSVNYRITGNPDYKSETIGFMTEIGLSGVGSWLQNYIFPPESETVSITGCQQAADSLILFGSIQKNPNSVNDATPSKAITDFFVMKISDTGDSSWMKSFNTSRYDSSSKTYSGYYCATSDIVATDDGNFFACANNIVFNIAPFAIYTDDDNSARIYKISSQGLLLDSIRIKFGPQNEVADLIKRTDGGLFIGFNPSSLGIFGNFELVGKRNSFIANLSSDLTLQNVSSIQTQFSDYLGSVCAMPDGHYAIEMMIQSIGSDHYKLEVIKTDENGNF